MSLIDYIRSHFDCDDITTDSQGIHFYSKTVPKKMHSRLYDLFKVNMNIFTLETFNFDIFVDFIKQPFPLYYPNKDDCVWRLCDYFNMISEEKICFIEEGQLAFHHNSNVKIVALTCKQQFEIKAKFSIRTRPWILINPRSIYTRMWERLIYRPLNHISLDQVLGIGLYFPKELSTMIGEYLTPKLEFGVSWIDVIRGYKVDVNRIRESL